MPQTFRRNFSSKALFDLRPHVDLLALVQMEDPKDTMTSTLKFSQVGKSMATLKPRSDRLSNMLACMRVLQISLNKGCDDSLAVHFHGYPDSICALHFYNNDIYSFLPDTQDQWLQGVVFDWDQ